MVEERGKSKDVDNLRSRLIEVHSKMQYQVKYKLANVLAPLIKIPAPTKYHYRFAIFLDPLNVMELKDIKNFHHSENVDTKTLVHHMKSKFYEYIIAAELAVNPKTPQILLGKMKSPYTSITTLTTYTLFCMKQPFWRGLVPSFSHTKIKSLGQKSLMLRTE